MRKRIKVAIGLTVACAATLVLAACATDNNPYDGLNGDGYGVRVRYDANGGQFAAVDNVSIVDTYNTQRAKDGVKLLAPGDERRGNYKDVTVISRTDYFLGGWFTGRTMNVSDDGTVLDVYGEPIEYVRDAKGDIVYETDSDGNVMHDEQNNAIPKTVVPIGYTYTGEWDFENDIFTVPQDWKFDKSKYDLTLYAAWVPNFSYRFFSKNAGGEWELSGTYAFNPLLQTDELSLPEWNEETGAMDYGSFPEVLNKTFEAVYNDKAMQTQATVLNHEGYAEFRAGADINHLKPRKDYYLSLKEGTYFRIKKAQQFVDNVNSGGYYEILDNLDFTDVVWPAGFYRGSFNGKIFGNNHTMSNISATVSSSDMQFGGLFGTVSAAAAFENVAFENVTVTFTGGVGRVYGSTFGLFAGDIAQGATFTNVSLTGKLLVGNVYSGFDYFTLGLVSGNLVDGGMICNVTCDVVETDNEAAPYPYKISVNQEEALVVISVNETPATKPEVGTVVDDEQ